MKPASEKLSQAILNSAMPLHEGLPLKALGHHHDLEMGFRVRWDVVIGGFVDDLQVLRRQLGRESRLDLRCDGVDHKTNTIAAQPTVADAKIRDLSHE